MMCLKSWFGTGTSNAIGVLQIKPLTSTSSSIAVPNIGPLSNLVSFASSRTFNVTPNGTFGQYIPAVPFANFADKSTVLSLQQIAQSIKARSNLGLVEGSGNPADLLIRVFGGNGQQLTQFTQHLNGGQHTQLNSFLLERGITLEDGRVEVQVTSSTGKVTAYASVLDNETSDAVLVTPVPLTAQGNTKWVLPGVADIRSGFADWQSDVRIFNAGTTSTNVTASFYSQGGGDARVQTLTLGAGEVKQFDKILPALFGVSNDAGALHLSTASAARIIATARTYNQTSKGTYGQFISAVTPQQSVAVGTRPLQLLQVEESSRMRSNIGFAEVTGKPVKLEVTVIPPDAKFAGIIEVDLGPNEYRQIGSLLATLGLGDTYNARISVRAISGTGRATTYAACDRSGDERSDVRGGTVMSQNKTKPNDGSVEDYIDSRANEQQRTDCRELMALLKKITRKPPRMWGPSIVGYGSYPYTYESGRTSESPLAAFAIRGRNLVVYVDVESESQKTLLAKLGKHKMGKVCLYFRQLADLDKSVLEQLIAGSIAEARRRYGS